MKKLIFIIISIFYTFHFNAQKNNPAPSIPVTDEYFGTKIIDEYRNLEDMDSPSTKKWMKEQTEYTNSILNNIPKRKFYLEKRLEFDKRQGYSISNLNITNNDKYFYLKKNGNEKVAKLYFRDGFSGEEQLLYNPANFKKEDANHEFVINYISPNWNGSKIAISLAEKGKELSEVIIMDVKNHYIHPEIITNTMPGNVGGIKWMDDDSGFFYTNFPVSDPKSPDFYKNPRVVFYKIGTAPDKVKDVFSAKNNTELGMDEKKAPIILDSNNGFYISMLLDNDYYRQTYIIPKQDLLQGRKSWKPFYNKEDKVRSLQIVDNDVFFLSQYNSQNYILCKTSLTKPDFINPEVLIPEKKDEVIGQYRITKDGIYYTTIKNGVEAKLYLYKGGKDILIKLPYSSGNINLQAKGKDFPDIWISCSGWANEEQRFRYDLKKDVFLPESLTPIIEYPEFKDIIVKEITVKARDGEDIPLSLIYNKNIKLNGKNPILIDAYGAYGYSRTPFFSRIYLLWANQGGVFAISHVRGGGEKGKKWRLGGYKETKPNTWRDLIDCTEYLINAKYTSKDKVAIWGASAGGITVGRAMTERPDLFKAAILEVPTTNILRDVHSLSINSDEYGNIKDPKEFKALVEMDPYQHIKKGVKYPATFITAGINDPRVMAWEPVKFAAKLQANNTSKNPILLQVDYEGGHGNNTTAYHGHSNLSDIFAFAFWQLGHPHYQPQGNSKK
ncbi:prolyl oligopeptidase [Elizabethkingia meningoseptica]|uniref:prolyl oligopeptidase family serine peptidase n=1 Tax=Elizabethkingia meningoseptica TaxID=238 RepID=UPI000999CBD0|nr:prolyl oligopeptidase family serine peptidase [Elizabethkingia meningoseptica]MDV3550069.1 prolyl oligopeptidase [Elizabethkingia anophelis]MDV3563665.1 prolyl oligopeptidase [Elizabethkingia anophelis]MDV3624928.1 prolyl oligopeptidase [Elizabethkingia anophelis]MDV3640715.1 prolyl oligopeptidase [Elizabethkingia anophelis]MDV3657873.1 prolyl oligopeptidase [Elizabethkingia anophelis]